MSSLLSIQAEAATLLLLYRSRPFLEYFRISQMSNLISVVEKSVGANTTQLLLLSCTSCRSRHAATPSCSFSSSEVDFWIAVPPPFLTDSPLQNNSTLSGTLTPRFQ